MANIFLTHMKIKSKISYLGEKISILPKKMTEQMAVEVDVKMVKNLKKSIFAPKIFWTSQILPHVKIKGKIGILGLHLPIYIEK